VGLPDLEPLVKVWLDPPVDGCQRAYTTRAGKKNKKKHWKELKEKLT